MEGLKGVERAVFDLSLGELTVEGRADKEAICGAVAKAGYTVEERLSPPAA